MRFAQVSGDRGIAPGGTKGASQHLRGVAAGLQGLGHDVELFTDREPQGSFPAPIRPLDELEPRASANQFDVIYERYSLGHRAGLEVARRAGLPFILEVNAPLVDEASAHRPGSVGPGAAEVEAELLAEADLVITVSSVLSEWAAERRTGPIETIANGFEPAWFDDEPAAGPPKDLVFIGHPKPWHGADRLVDVLVGLGRLGQDCELLVIGGGPGVDSLLERAEHCGVRDRIETTGALAPSQASAHLRRGRIGMAPYRRIDPFYFCPLKVIDYLAAGLAIVASDIGDVPTLVHDNAVLVDPDDDDKLVAATAELVSDRARCAEMGQAGRRRALDSMTWTDVARRTVEAMELRPGGVR